MFHVFNASLSGRVDSIKNIGYIWQPKMNIYYVAAKETMKAGLLARIMAYAGAVTVERTWREKGKSIKREVNPNDTENIGKALDDGWVITFPQGTTKPFKPIRKGTAHIIKNHKPLVIPIVIDGFRRSFDKKKDCVSKSGEFCRVSRSNRLWRSIMKMTLLKRSWKNWNLRLSSTQVS